jgi:hypothetical protein
MENLPKPTNKQQQLSETNKSGQKFSVETLIRKEIEQGVKIFNVGDVDIAALMEYLFVFTGLTSDKRPDKMGKMILLGHIKRACQNLTIEEVKKAFELGVEGYYDIDMNHYQSFSSLYFSSVINAYVEYRRRIVAKINKERVEQQAVKDELTPEQKTEINNRFLYNFIYLPFVSYCKRGGLDFGSVPIGHIYLTLEDLKVINITNKLKKELHADVTLRIGAILKKRVAENPVTKNEIDYRNKVAKVLNGEFQKYRDSEIVEECRRIILLNTFEDYRVGKKNLLANLNIEKWAIDSGFVLK